jgi:hypothetical protein
VAARTGPDGSYNVDVPPGGAYMLGIDDETWAAPSLKSPIVVEDQPQAGMDITLTRGSLLHGQLTEGADHHPSSGARLSLTEDGGVMPKDLREGGSGRMQLARRAMTGPDGRYKFRVAPGRYQLLAPLSGTAPVEFDVKAEAEIVHDIALKNSQRASTFEGTVVEKTPAGERPVAGARVHKNGVGTTAGYALTDARGRFQMRETPGEYVLYALAENGLAGFAPLNERPDGVKVFVSASTTVSGRVVDSSGKPLPGRKVGVALAGGSTLYLKSMYFSYVTRTDDQGRFTLKGAPVGSKGHFSVSHQKDGSSTTPSTVVRFLVPELIPIQVPDLIVPSEKPVR